MILPTTTARLFSLSIAAGLGVLAAPATGWPQESEVRPAVVLIEFEDHLGGSRTSAGAVARQEMQRFGPGWSGAQLFWRAPAPGGAPVRSQPNLRVPFTLPAPGTFDVVLHHTVAPDFATFRVFLDGRAVADVDAYASSVLPRARTLGRRTLAAGRHELVITVTGRAARSTGYAVGLDRLALHRTTTTTDTNPHAVSVPAGNLRLPPAPGTTHRAADPAAAYAAVCLASPATCCPNPAAMKTDGCRIVTEMLLDIRIRSYVPPRFTVLGRHYPFDADYHLANIVSDVTVKGPYSVWPGCRFNVSEATNSIEDSKSILEKAGSLLEAWLSQWSGAVEDAKSFVSAGVADVVCDVVDDSQSCRDAVAPVVKAGINLGLVSLGIPPEIPDLRQLREHGIRYLAAVAVSYALGDGAIWNSLPVDEKTRAYLYQQAYGKAVDVLSKQLNTVIPPANFSSAKPATWGHLEPAYAPHNAHLYVEVRVRPGQYGKYLELLAASPKHQWAPLYLHDLNTVYASKGPIQVPAFIPPDGVILPVELRPYDVPYTEADTAKTQIPGTPVSRVWLEKKFGINPHSGLVNAQRNYLPRINSMYGFSDWDLFYKTSKQADFRLLMPVGTGVLDWEINWEKNVGAPFDAEVGGGVVVSGQLKNYYGRIDPAPRCDGKPAIVYEK